MSDLHTNEQIRLRLLSVVSLCSDYCFVCENASEMTKEEFVDRMLDILPRLYWEFFDLSIETVMIEEFDYFGTYVDEDYYESVRRHIETVMGEHDTYLETFEEDMKYSETPIAASVAENLADIFQPLFNFISIVKDTEGEKLTDAYSQCKENFVSYWSQTLCNVLRALNNIKYSTSSEF